MIRYLIVDDEPLAHELIKSYCDLLPHLQLEKNCYNAMEALEFLNGNSVDIMFLDLNMPDLGGFDFLKTLSKPPKTIVTTAYKEYALEGYQLNVVDYLLKPFSFERIVQAINKAIDTHQSMKSVTTRDTTEKRFFIKGDKKHHQVSSSDILFIEGYGNYTKLFLEKEMIISHENISHYQSFLPVADFLRVHRSFIVSVSKIKSIEGNRIKIEEHHIPIGQTYRSLVGQLYNS